MNNSTHDTTIFYETCTSKRLIPIYLVMGICSGVGYYFVLRILIQKKLYNKSRYLIVLFLSITDCTFNVTVMSFVAGLTLLSDGPLCSQLSKVGIFVCRIAFMVSCGLSLGLCINQYIAVVYGLRYEAIVTRRRIKTLSLVCLVGSTIISGLAFIEKQTYALDGYELKRTGAYIATIGLVFCISIMTASLIHSSHISKSRFRKMSERSRKSRYWQRRQRIRSEVLVVTSIVIAALVPQLVFSTKILFAENPDTMLNYYLLNIARGPLLLFCALNPYLYLFTLHELRREMARKLKKYLCCACCHPKLVKQLTRLERDIHKGNDFFETACAESEQLNVSNKNEMVRKMYR